MEDLQKRQQFTQTADMVKIKYLLFLVLGLGFLEGNAQKLNLEEQINSYFHRHVFDSVLIAFEKGTAEWKQIMSGKSKIKKIDVLRHLAMSALYMGEVAKAKEYALKIRQIDLFYEIVANDSEALKSLLRKHKKMPKLQAGIWAGWNRSFVQPVGELNYLFDGWRGTTPEDTWWENTKDYRGLYSWQAGGQVLYYLNRYVGFFGGFHYQNFHFEYQTSQKYTLRVRNSPDGEKVRYNDDLETKNTINTLSNQVLHYYGGQVGLLVYKHFEKWNSKIYWQQGFAWAGLLQANRIAEKAINQHSPAISPSTRTEESFYQNNWLGFTKIGISYQYRNFTWGIEGAYYQALSPISRVSYTHEGSMSLATDYYDLLDRVNLKNIQANLTMAYTLKHRIK